MSKTKVHSTFLFCAERQKVGDNLVIQDITIINIDTGEQIFVSSDGSTNYVLDEIDWGQPEIEQSSYQIPKKVGKVFSGISVGDRKIVIYGFVISDNVLRMSGITWEEFYRLEKQSVERAKGELNHVISVYENYMIKHDEKYILCKPSAAIKYSQTYQENNETFCKFQIEFNCFDPLFYGEKKVYSNYGTNVNPNVTFPMNFPVVFGTVNEYATGNTILLINDSEIESDCIMRMEVISGEINNPIITIQGKEKQTFAIVTNAKTGETIEIITETGEEDAYKVGRNITSLLGKVTKESIYFKIPKGTSEIKYQYETVKEATVFFIVEFQEKHFNLRDM